MSCVIHHVSDRELELIPLTDALINKIENAKVLHEGTDDSIFCAMLSFLPVELFAKRHCVHKACYEKFTCILRVTKSQAEKVQAKSSFSRISRSASTISNALPSSSSKTLTARSSQEIPVRSSKRISSTPSSETRNKFVYPKECTICNRYQIKIHRVKEKPNLLTEKSAAAHKPEYAELYSKILDQDLPQNSSVIQNAVVS